MLQENSVYLASALARWQCDGYLICWRLASYDAYLAKLLNFLTMQIIAIDGLVVDDISHYDTDAKTSYGHQSCDDRS